MVTVTHAAPALAVALLAASCSFGGGADERGPITAYDPDPDVLNIVAGSEQRAVVDEVVTPWCQDAGLTCNVDYLGSVDQARLLQSGTAPYDAFWFASSAFQQLGDEERQLQDARPMSLTPIVFAGWKSEMEELGLVGRDVTLDEVLDVVESGQTTTWVTNPTQSNSGATTYLATLSYVAGNDPGQPLTADQLDDPDVVEAISAFVQAFDRTPPSTGTMMDACLAAPDSCRTMFTYEDLVMERNRQLVADGEEPLYLVYPEGALAISDAPLGFFPHEDNPEKKASFDALQSYLLTDPDATSTLLELGRRPADVSGLALTDAPDVFNPEWGVRTTVSGQRLVYPSGPVIEAALSDYQQTFRNPADLVYCIDGSGSMAGNGGWDAVEQAAELLFDPAQAQRYLLQVNPDDRTTVLVFSDQPRNEPWTVEGDDSADLLGLKERIQALPPGGGTAIYDCLGRAADYYAASPGGSLRQFVILMTDGQNTDGGTEGLTAIEQQGVPVIAIAFGSDADTDALAEIADRTGGVLITSDNLVKALRDATSYR